VSRDQSAPPDRCLSIERMYSSYFGTFVRKRSRVFDSGSLIRGSGA
jgi:hypothetical protein